MITPRFEPEDEFIVQIFKDILGSAFAQGAGAIYITINNRKESGRISFLLRPDETLQEIMHFPIYIIAPLIKSFHLMVDSQNSFSIRLKSEEQQFSIEYHISVTTHESERESRTVLNIDSQVSQNTITISNEDVLQVSNAMDWDVDFTKSFLLNASPLFYMRFVEATRSPKRNVFGLIDPIEYDPEFAPYIEKAGQEAETVSKDEKEANSAIEFWHIKKRILREKYNIIWFTPAQMNSNGQHHINFDLPRLNSPE